MKSFFIFSSLILFSFSFPLQAEISHSLLGSALLGAKPRVVNEGSVDGSIQLKQMFDHTLKAVTDGFAATKENDNAFRDLGMMVGVTDRVTEMDMICVEEKGDSSVGVISHRRYHAKVKTYGGMPFVWKVKYAYKDEPEQALFDTPNFPVTITLPQAKNVEASISRNGKFPDGSNRKDTMKIFPFSANGWDIDYAFVHTIESVGQFKTTIICK